MKIGGRAKKLIVKSGLELMKLNFVMEHFLKWGEKEILKGLVNKNQDNRPLGSQELKYHVIKNLMHALVKRLKDGNLSPYIRNWVFNTLVGDVILNLAERHPEVLEKKKNREPVPTFITISPGQECNLACRGCYAASSNKTLAAMEWGVLDRIMYQKRELWGSYFTVISGGEPLLYKSQGHTIFDLFEKYNDNFFLMYTNGTYIDRATARRLVRLGNVAPAISVEGFEAQTDARRGKGVFGAILKAMEYLREEGALFGLSLTATRSNVDTITSDEFIEFFFERRGAAFAWLFQYLPIGRGPDFDFMITPEQRRNLWIKENELIEERGIFFIDFWNGGPISDGCISAGRKGGYLYIDWNGSVMPCVFVPYSVGNIKTDFFDKGKDLDDVLRAPFLAKLRKWQDSYNYRKEGVDVNNEIVPCPIRDHHSDFNRIARESGVKGVDRTAQKALYDDTFVKELTDIGVRSRAATEDIWRRKFLKLDT